MDNRNYIVVESATRNLPESSLKRLAKRGKPGKRVFLFDNEGLLLRAFVI